MRHVVVWVLMRCFAPTDMRLVLQLWGRVLVTEVRLADQDPEVLIQQ